MPKEDYQAICDKVREKTGKTEVIKSGDMPTFLDEFTGGGGSGESSDLVKYVTFMSEDGTTELFVMPVLSGDDCKEPIEHGDMETPTKESTAQYNYTYSGWSATSGGAADSTVLQSITEDKTVYAAFAASTRYYTVNYYDDDNTTLLYSAQFEYGADASLYVPEKDGYTLTGWTVDVSRVTTDTDTCAIWEEGITLATCSWERIAEISEAGEAENYFAIGDEKTVEINGETITFRIVGFNHDTLSGESGTAGITFMTKDIPNIKGSGVGISNIIYDTFYSYLPTELTNVLKSVLKECETSSSGGTDTQQLERILFAPSFTEIGKSTSYSTSYYNVLGTVYEYYSNNSVSYYYYTDGTKANPIYIRGLQRVGVANPITLTSGGKISANTSGDSYPYIFGFCV